MTIMYTRSLLFMLVYLLINGCKSTDSNLKPVSKAPLLIRSWKVQLIASTVIASNRMVVFYERDAPNNLSDFSTNIVQYNADGTYVATATNSTQTVIGKWELIEDETKLVITPPNHVPQRIATLENLSETQFSWYYSVLEPSQGSLEESMYNKLKDAYHEDVSKGIKITYRYIPY